MHRESRAFVLDNASGALPGLLLRAAGTANGQPAGRSGISLVHPGSRPAAPASDGPQTGGERAVRDGDPAVLPGWPAWSPGGPARTVRRSWLDTFDWRLYRAGLTLEQVSGDGAARLVLSGRDGAVLAEQRLAAGAPSWPALVAVVPPGPLREELEPVVGVRALAPVARAVSRVTQLRALNADQKTVARVAVDRMSVTFPARATVPPRLTVTPVRGYQAQADRVGRAIGEVPGVRVGRGSALEAALAAAGKQPGERPGKASVVALSPAEPAATALAAILLALLDALEANVPGTVRDTDTEFLHDLRIAGRWTRSALKLCGNVLPEGMASQYRPQFRWLGDLTTPARDLDVYLLRIPAMTASLVGAAAGDLDPFADYLAGARAAAHRRLARGLRSARFTGLVTSWRADLASVRAPRKGPAVARVAAARIASANRRALRAGSAITAASPPESLHDLRKRCKELRYLVEMFGSLHDPARHWQAIRELKALQDCLGEFQDAEVQRDEIRALAGQMLAERRAPAETLLAMGEVAAGLAQRQYRARSEFDGRFADFAGAASQARLLRLSEAAAR